MDWLWRHAVLPSLIAVLVAGIAFPSVLDAEQRRRRPRTGFIEVSSMTAGADVFIDGETVGQVPLPEKIRVPVGEHKVKVTRRGFTQHLEVVRVKNRRTATVTADLIALTGILRVESDVIDARVFIDDDYVGNTPLDYDVEPGTRHLRISHSGYYDFERDIDIVAGEETEVIAELERLPPEQDPTIPQEPPERRWYEHWWVWTIVGVVVVSAAVAIPVAVTQQGDTCSDHAGWPSCDDGSVLTINVE